MGLTPPSPPLLILTAETVLSLLFLSLSHSAAAASAAAVFSRPPQCQAADAARRSPPPYERVSYMQYRLRLLFLPLSCMRWRNGQKRRSRDRGINSAKEYMPEFLLFARRRESDFPSSSDPFPFTFLFPPSPPAKTGRLRPLMPPPGSLL